jgi:hypothetical protein
MKKLFTILMCSVLFLFVQLSVSAQDSTQPGAVKQINKTNEQADKIYGKEIQKRTLTTKSFESLDSAASKANKTKKKCCKKCRRKHR